jgi:surface antigen
MKRIKVAGWLAIGVAVPLVAGCANNTESGAAIGAGAGAALGAGVGSLVHSSAGVGALIGAGAGALSGALIGNAMDEQDKRQTEELRSLQPTKGYVQNSTVSKQDVVDWTRRGVKDEIIIDRIDRSGTKFHLTAADENMLREQGVSEDVVREMKQTARR